ncbi:protein of unknown function [Cupriavidus taiwanensis]|uniref:Uncharacterized protein n=1 Tax=Cupriavidus taiwanensis TaxID=164546 RepID=A0A375ICM7_9BURK|nr:hypothetical protein CBM2592_A250010 [Cupriavidus taiwanensis]SOY51418.1 hypothetical protein CBM2588_A200010 [Cupriavidus taiwanensis]SOY83992.1 hypothetical protein CBM2591_A290010 [Cupriavidus taiwanensis]SOZ23699.1 hypothetical protein CBM2608_A290032 [Cupriavidus taiwanensis]SOZ58289.1 hypothetical protein CBM2617_A290010 [Cupriavidus taiwanensis]
MPSAMAPELTSTTSLPATRSLAIWAAQRAMASWSSPLPSLVTRLEPTFTTMRFACAMTDCMVEILSAIVFPSPLRGEGRVRGG